MTYRPVVEPVHRDRYAKHAGVGAIEHALKLVKQAEHDAERERQWLEMLLNDRSSPSDHTEETR